MKSGQLEKVKIKLHIDENQLLNVNDVSHLPQEIKQNNNLKVEPIVNTMQHNGNYKAETKC